MFKTQGFEINPFFYAAACWNKRSNQQQNCYATAHAVAAIKKYS